ncbi:PREDICTED: early nodulin-like protein 2 [Camelina sativa]|uniref:Early nodulin-like protein 2 n=1 Tax=Camelina sativa TaxID=90675 RepID=A0ABM0TYR2_CAMSA|nr:PREDICTED: early nodulin-like protein 2 [Camelina sativa]
MTFLKMKSLSFFFTILLSLSAFFTISDARKFSVGGSGAWVTNPPENYDSWSGKNRFLVHDTLYFSYAKGADSVLEVNKADYDGCNTKNPIKRVDDGDSEISLDRYGPFYFISGNEDNCKKGQKLAVVVISPRTPSTAQPPHAAAPGSSPPGSTTPPGGAHSPKSSSPVSPTTSPPGSMAPKSGSPVSPTVSPPAPPKSSSPVSPSSAPMTSPPAPMAPKSSSTVPPSSAPITSPPAPMAPKSSSTVPPSSAPMTSPPGPMAPEASSPVSNSTAVSPSLAPGDSTSLPPSDSPSATPSGSAMGPSGDGSAMGPSGDGPSASGDISTPGGAPGQKKSSANGMAVMSITTTVLSLVLAIFIMSA